MELLRYEKSIKIRFFAREPLSRIQAPGEIELLPADETLITSRVKFTSDRLNNVIAKFRPFLRVRCESGARSRIPTCYLRILQLSRKTFYASTCYGRSPVRATVSLTTVAQRNRTGFFFARTVTSRNINFTHGTMGFSRSRRSEFPRRCPLKFRTICKSAKCS